ncbi:MAG: hypothetical protein JW808_09995, partial [Victivallales bacterium]|nr:hypothetical protein [Victivallales bacterium]
MSKKEHWQIDTAKLADEIVSSSRLAASEEDLKMRLEPLLRRQFIQIGIDVEIAAYEKTTTVTKKRMDAVYGYVVIEYKAPGKLSSKKDIENAKKQMQVYLEEESHRHGPHHEDFLEKAVGVAIDGERIIFAR